MTELCRAALWYTDHVEIVNTKMHGIKALRECAQAVVKGCDIISPEFGWSVRGIEMEDTTAQSEYFMMRSDHLDFRNVSLKGKYSFQYITDAVFENCNFDTKDYLAWYSENVTFENCKIIGTQPLCYCRGLKLADCQMIDTDLAFERSEVEARITTPVISIKNPYAGHIEVPEVGEIIRDDENAKGVIETLR